MKTDMVSLYESILKLLESYLEAVDVTRCGFGIDPYYESEPKDHPMAYGLFARGLSRLYQVTGKNGNLSIAINCLERLRQLSSSRQKYLCWGLSFSWKGFPASYPYAITTAIVGEGFLEVYRQTRESSYLEDLYKICSWLVEGLEWNNVSRVTACPWFAPGFPVLVNNVASKVGALLWQVSDLIHEQRFKRYGEKALRYVLMQQAPEGFWIYRKSTKEAFQIDGNTVDNIHTAYTLEGLIDYYRSLSMFRRWLYQGLKNQIHKGLHFYTTHLFQGGRALEKVLIMEAQELEQSHTRSKASRQWKIKSLKKGRFLVYYPVESRLWGYGAAITTLAKAAAYKICPRVFGVLIDIFQFVKEHLVTDEGRWRYKSDNEHIYIRHEAHVFNGLCEMLWALKERGVSR